MTRPEVLLWQALRRHSIGLKFRKQHPAGQYTLDFYCASANLAIEADGEVHSSPRQIEHDHRRDFWLASRGVRMMRIPARNILADLADVIAGIAAAASPDQPLHRPADGPPPRSGEDFPESS